MDEEVEGSKFPYTVVYASYSKYAGRENGDLHANFGRVRRSRYGYGRSQT